MWSSLNHPLVVLFARVVLGLVLLIAGLSKLQDRKGFIQAVASYEILPQFLTRPFGILLPWLELGTAVLLLSGRIPTVAGLLAVILLICFMVAIGVNLLRGRRPACHCFGQLYQEKIGAGVLFQDGVLLALAVEIVAFHRGLLPTNDNLMNPSQHEVLLVILLSSAFVIVFSLLQQMRALFERSRVPE